MKMCIAETTLKLLQASAFWAITVFCLPAKDRSNQCVVETWLGFWEGGLGHVAQQPGARPAASHTKTPTSITFGPKCGPPLVTVCHGFLCPIVAWSRPVTGCHGFQVSAFFHS